MTLRALIVDDESPARKELRFLLQPYEEIQIIGEAENALEALDLINTLEYSIIFLDVDMPGLRGLELAKHLQKRKNSPMIIFITAHEEFAVEAFAVEAFDYLLKPINPKRLEQSIKKIMASTSAKSSSAQPVDSSSVPSTNRPLEVIPVEQRGKTILLRPEEIIFIYTDKENVFVKTQKESYLARFTLRDLESRLSSSLFFRSHRCYLVNVKRMRELIPYFNGTYTVVVDDQDKSEVPVSRAQARKLKEILGLY